MKRSKDSPNFLTLLLLAAIWSFSSCADQRSDEAKIILLRQGPLSSKPYGQRSFGAGIWKNEYRNDPRLAGVEVMTDPLEGPFETPSYIGMHPAEVFYHFWDGTIRWTSFTPEGAKVNDQWIWPDHKRLLDEALKLAGKERIRRLRTLVLFELGNDVNSWACVDFSYGSDPLFSRHKDPRRVLFETLSAYEK